MSNHRIVLRRHDVLCGGCVAGVVEVHVDADAIFAALAQKAIASRDGVATTTYGAVKVVADNIRRADQQVTWPDVMRAFAAAKLNVKQANALAGRYGFTVFAMLAQKPERWSAVIAELRSAL